VYFGFVAKNDDVTRLVNCSTYRLSAKFYDDSLYMGKGLNTTSTGWMETERNWPSGTGGDASQSVRKQVGREGRKGRKNGWGWG